jgi:hypothetical protein
MSLSPSIVIHGIAQARMALRPGLPVTLLSAQGAALYAGCGWWRAVSTAAGGDRPDVIDVLDCADAPGRALEALSVGCRWLVLHPCPAWASVAERAAFYGATMLDRRPEALDLATPGAERRIDAWLGIG